MGGGDSPMTSVLHSTFSGLMLPLRSALTSYCRHIAVSFFQVHPDLRIFQRDNDTPHTAVARRFWAQQPFLVLDWPADSPDMDPTEHGWDELKELSVWHQHCE